MPIILDNRKGFTLVELIIVIAIISILAGAIFVAIDPARRLNETRNARRSSDVATILDAVRKHQVDNDGVYYGEIANGSEDTYYVIGTGGTGCLDTCGSISVDDECIDLSDMGSNYLAVVPVDPKDGNDENSGYYFLRSSDGSFEVGACHPEGEEAGGNGIPPEIRIVR